MRRAIVLAISVVLTAGCGAAIDGQTKNEQRIFDAESATLQHPIPLPPEVLQVLSADKDVKDMSEGRPGPVPKEWFSASLITTAKPSLKLYVVVGNGPLIGAHVTTFWLVRCTGRTAPTVLLKAVADRLEVGKADASGYPRVTAVRLTAASMADTVYHFASGKYIPTHR